MYLVDTNIWLEILLEQEKAQETKLNLTLISFDSDFNKTPEKRVLPGQIVH